MTNPNSVFSRLRRELAEKIEPKPDAGEGWCINCSLEEGRTLVLPANGFQRHAQKHSDTDGHDHMQINVAWPRNSRS